MSVEESVILSYRTYVACTNHISSFFNHCLLWQFICFLCLAPDDDTSILNPTEALMSAAVYLSQLLKELFGDADACVVVHLSVWH